MSQLTHFDSEGRAHMVDVTGKTPTHREATAEGFVLLHPDTLKRILDRGMEKGDALAVAQLAGICGAKRTADLIPLCHPLPLTGVQVSLEPDLETSRVRILATARTTGNTGVEMEALTAVSVAALTLYDMCKAIDRGMTLSDIRLLRKAGGRSGVWERSAQADTPSGR